MRPSPLIALALFSLSLVGFTSQGQPVDILPEADECATCVMAIENLPVASELTLRDGDVKKFDDIGCMAQYVKRKRLKESAIKGMFVHDLPSGRWVPLERATLVKSSYPTPMRYGIVAFATPAGAKKMAAKYKPKLVSWADVLKGI